MEGEFPHLPVMGREVVELLLPVPPGLIVDGTVGGGGHAALLLEARPDIRVLGIDRDAEAVAAARTSLARFGGRAEVVHGGFERMRDVIPHDEEEVMGVLLDLGVSSPQLDRPDRGFSYRFDAPLDMRMDAAQALTAAAVVNDYTQEELADLIFRYGEERYARRIARAIVARRPLATTRDLVDAIVAAIPGPARRRGGHPARRTFQAIRMEVNKELPNLAEGLDASVHRVGPGGRVLVLAYHSLEDRIVKERFRDWAGETVPELPHFPVEEPGRTRAVRVLTRRALRPSADEVAQNPRSKSARLRAVERLPTASAG